MRFFLIVFMLLFSFFSCKSEQEKQIDVSNIDIDFSIKRFDVDFYRATKVTLPKVKNNYPYLFPKSFSDSLAIAKINNSDEQELFSETQKNTMIFQSYKVS